MEPTCTLRCVKILRSPLVVTVALASLAAAGALAPAIGGGSAASADAARGRLASGAVRGDGSRSDAPAAAAAPELEPTPIRFGRDIRPILSDSCFLCHGPDRDHQKAGLRLDIREEAIAPREDGAAIVPGDPEASEIWRRINSHDPDEVMPTPESGKSTLSPAERELIRRWIEMGAPY